MAYGKSGGKGGKGKKKGFYKKDYLFKRKKYCKFCDTGVAFIDYKDVKLLSGYLRERAKIVPRRISGNLRNPSAATYHRHQAGTAPRSVALHSGLTGEGRMKIILKENVEGLGARGAIVNVKDGYARNYLLPKGIAMRYTPGAQKVLQQERRMYETKQLQAKEEAQELAEKISSLDLSVAKRAGDQDVLYGSVTVTDLAEMIKRQGIILDKRKIILNEPIKKLGDYEIGVKLHQEVDTLGAPARNQRRVGCRPDHRSGKPLPFHCPPCWFRDSRTGSWAAGGGPRHFSASSV